MRQSEGKSKPLAAVRVSLKSVGPQGPRYEKNPDMFGAPRLKELASEIGRFCPSEPTVVEYTC